MKITFLGTAASEGVPAMFCSCKYCQDIRKRGAEEFRTRTQVLIDGDLSIDFPPEAYIHSLNFGVDLSALKYLIVTHSHMDHFYAHDFVLRGYKYARLEEDMLSIYGNEEVAKVFGECTRRELKAEVASHVKMNVIKPYRRLLVGDYKIITLPAMHGTKEEALLYYVEKGGKGYLHLYDTGDLSDEAIDFLAKNNAKADAVAFDCTFLDAPYEKGRRHMCVEGDVDLANRLERAGITGANTVKIITHFSHNAYPVRERIEAVEKQYGLVAAYDGFSIDI
ncbi:MAG: MBL fold metallo-hydrolase [Candidatus Coproplasma sp.]